MKPAIAYGITGDTWSSDWEIIAITSEKSGRRGMVYGRDEHGNATHHKPDDVRGRYATIEEAEQARAAVRQVHRQHAGAIERAEQELGRLQLARRSAIQSALGSVKITKPVMVLE